MNGRRRLGVISAVATLLAAAPLASIFESWAWLLQAIVAVAMICGAAALARTLRFPVWVQALGMAVALLLSLTWLFPGDHSFLLPGPGAFHHFGELFTQAGEDTRSYSVPVPDRDSLQFVAVLGIGAVAIAVDLLTVVARRPALAGLPMLAIYSVPVAVYVDSVPVVPFIIGACGYLWLLVSDNVDRVRRFGRRFTGDGRDVDVWEPSPLAAAARRLGLIGVAAAVLLPIAVPEFNGGLLSQLTQGGPGVNGSGSKNGSGKISLSTTLRGTLHQNKVTNLVDVRTDDPNPFYLRFGVADQLDANGTSDRPPTGQSIDRGLAPDPRLTGIPAGTGAVLHHAVIRISSGLSQTLAPIYDNTIDIDKGIGKGWSYDPSQNDLFSQRKNITTQNKTYTVTYVRLSYSQQTLRDAAPLTQDEANVKAYTSTPPDQKVADLVKTATQGKGTEYDKVEALMKELSVDKGFTYDLKTGDSDGQSAIDAFLFTNKKGYCQQYATALMWLARAAGIPARVAFGFTKGNGSAGHYTLTNANAHAWTEIYFNGLGWLPFDATPSSQLVGAASTDYAPNVNPSATTSVSVAPNVSLPAVGGSAGSNADDIRAHREGTTASGALGTTGAAGSGKSLWIAIAIALLLALLLVPALVRALLRRRRHAATAGPPTATVLSGSGGNGIRDLDVVVTAGVAQARADAHAAWDELIDTMADFRVPIDLSETPRVTARRIVKESFLTGTDADAATLLGTAEEKARYARTPMRGAELTKALHDVRKGFARSASRRTRLVAVIMPPSTLLRWRIAFGEWSGRVAVAASRARDFLVRFSPRRLLPRSSR